MNKEEELWGKGGNLTIQGLSRNNRYKKKKKRCVPNKVSEGGEVEGNSTEGLGVRGHV